MDPAIDLTIVNYDDGEQQRVFSVSSSTSLFSLHFFDKIQIAQSRT
jgi:hypothetical protein